MPQKKEETPLVRQYLEIKKDYPDAIVFFRLGDFYELFFDDAVSVCKLLELTLTKKSSNRDIPMCGMPHHAVKPYIKKLVDNGYKIAIAEQITPPGKGLVERKVIKLITPGQVIDDGILQDSKNNFIAAISFFELGFYMSYSDISTGESFLKYPLKKMDVLENLKNLEVKEVVISYLYDKEFIKSITDKNILVNEYNNHKIFESKLLKEITDVDAKKSACLLLNFLKEKQMQELNHMQPFIIEKGDDYLFVDNKFFDHLEIFRSNFSNDEFTLFNVLNQTKTAQGARYLRQIMLNPIKNYDKLKYRINLVKDLSSIDILKNLQKELVYIYDINRILGRLSTNNLNPIDLIWLKNSLNSIPNIKKILCESKIDNLISFASKLSEMKNIKDLIERAILENPERAITQGGIIKSGFNKDLDDLKNINKTNNDWIKEYEEKEREKTGIKNLRVSYNSVFGFYIEISKGNLDLIKDEYGYKRKQTLTNLERFTTKDLKDREDLIINCEKRINDLEYEIFKSVKNEILKEKNLLQELALNISILDTFQSLSYVSLLNNYKMSEYNNLNILDLKNARHPVVEKFTKIIPNDAKMQKGDVNIITGPNMGGKSTYMRTVALCVYLAHIGSFVPCDYASIPIYDKIYTRIGSSDNIAGGLSTFMVEMVEANDAIKGACANSILFFDEIGRGTATFDGMALAYAILDYIIKNVGCHLMFSTHYHELTDLENKYQNIKNLNAIVKLENNKMVFLYKILEGISKNSYGIDVAGLANLPSQLLNTARMVLEKLEKNSATNEIKNIKEGPKAKEKVEVFDKTLDEIKKLNLDNMTPIEALIYLKNLQKKE